MECPTRRAEREGGLKGHLRFGKAAVQIHEPVSMAVLDDRTTAVPLHGKISPPGMADDANREERYRKRIKGIGINAEI